MKRPGTGVVTATLRATFEAEGGDQKVTLAGSIDENAELEKVFSQLTGDTIFNMRNVERVNSMGVHRWIPMVTRFTAQHRLMIDEISYALVQNANVVANLFGSAQVRSCMAPYFCGKCQNNTTVTVTAEEVVGDNAPAKKCSQCSSEMEFDELDGYFAFFKAKPRKR